jgi:hypothetical protein
MFHIQIVKKKDHRQALEKVILSLDSSKQSVLRRRRENLTRVLLSGGQEIRGVREPFDGVDPFWWENREDLARALATSERRRVVKN